MEIVKSMKAMASFHSAASVHAAMIHAAGVAMKAAVPLKPVILRNREIAGSAQHQRGCRKP